MLGMGRKIGVREYLASGEKQMLNQNYDNLNWASSLNGSEFFPPCPN